MLVIGSALSDSFSFIVPMYPEVIQIDDDSMAFDAPRVLVSAFEQFISYIVHLG